MSENKILTILYSPLGTTDPISNYHDGGMLHILRHYKPDKLVLFLTKEIEDNHLKDNLYEKAIRSVNESIDIEYIYTGITDPHNMESLAPLQDNFIAIREKYPNAKILLNLSSGTPQMKNIMFYLSIEYTNVLGVQVSTPVNKSNKSSSIDHSKDSIEDLIETNEDNDPKTESRCSEPKLGIFRKTYLRAKIEENIKVYRYQEALKLFNTYAEYCEGDNPDKISIVKSLLKHAFLRTQLDDKAMDELKNLPCRKKLKNPYDKELCNIWEYLMIMQIRLKEKYIDELLIRMTPYLYEITKYYLKYGPLQIDFNKVGCSDFKSSGRIDIKLLEKIYPKTYEFFKYLPYTNDKITLTYNHMQEYICGQSEIDQSIKNKLKLLRKAESEVRNRLAHQIKHFTDAEIKNITGYDIRSLYNEMLEYFYLAINSNDKNKKHIYDIINEEVLDNFPS